MYVLGGENWSGRPNAFRQPSHLSRGLADGFLVRRLTLDGPGSSAVPFLTVAPDDGVKAAHCSLTDACMVTHIKAEW